MTDLPTDGGETDSESGPPLGKGELAETREYITRRMQELAEKAMAIYELTVSPGRAPRNIQTHLLGARDIVQFLTEGKVSQPMVSKPRPLASVTDLAAISEQVRLAKQTERRGR